MQTLIRSKQQTFPRSELVVWMHCKYEWYFVVYIDFPKMERNGGRIMKFREDTTLLVSQDLLSNFGFSRGSSARQEGNADMQTEEEVRSHLSGFRQQGLSLQFSMYLHIFVASLSVSQMWSELLTGALPFPTILIRTQETSYCPSGHYTRVSGLSSKAVNLFMSVTSQDSVFLFENRSEPKLDA